VPFRHDVVRFLFQDKQELNLHDFDNIGWNQWYRQHGSTANACYYGRTIFPIRIKSYLQWTQLNGFVKTTDGTLQQKQRTCIEMVRFYIVKENC